MIMIRARIHNGYIEPLEPVSFPIEEGKEVAVFIPEDKLEESLSVERKALLGRIDAFRNWYGPLGCSVKDLIREGRRNG